MEKYVFLISGWIIYLSLHSIFADDRVKHNVMVLLGKRYTVYRLLFNIFSTIGLLVMLFINAGIPSSFILEPGGWTRYVSLMLATFGIFIFKAAFKQYSMKGFMGLESDDSESFKAEGILKHIRHPIYAATILVVLGFWLFTPNITTLISAGCIFIYLAIGIPLEERKLIKKYGDAYRDYKKQVPALIPKFW